MRYDLAKTNWIRRTRRGSAHTDSSASLPRSGYCRSRARGIFFSLSTAESHESNFCNVDKANEIRGTCDRTRLRIVSLSLSLSLFLPWVAGGENSSIYLSRRASQLPPDKKARLIILNVRDASCKRARELNLRTEGLGGKKDIFQLGRPARFRAHDDVSIISSTYGNENRGKKTAERAAQRKRERNAPCPLFLPLIARKRHTHTHTHRSSACGIQRQEGSPLCIDLMHPEVISAIRRSGWITRRYISRAIKPYPREQEGEGARKNVAGFAIVQPWLADCRPAHCTLSRPVIPAIINLFRRGFVRDNLIEPAARHGEICKTEPTGMWEISTLKVASFLKAFRVANSRLFRRVVIFIPSDSSVWSTSQRLPKYVHPEQGCLPDVSEVRIQ